MPGLVPHRRKRGEEEASSQESSATPSSSSTGSKRARFDRDASVESSDTVPVRNFANSHRNGNCGDDGYTEEPYQPGSIVRVKMTNFVTYTSAEFHPGPSLNMVIGPNGTGKSTLVCAICLGLGWSPAHLGRAKDLGEFVKHGFREAEIEIELAATPRMSTNPIVRRIIKREGNKSHFQINGRQATNKDVIKLAKSFSIQIDNLCQFLPQDRVVEFSAMTPVDMLRETQRAAAPEEMIQWHEQLKGLRADQKKLESEKTNEEGHLGRLVEKQNGSREVVERLRQRKDLQVRAVALQKAKPLVEFNISKEGAKEARQRRKQTERDLAQLRREVEPLLQAARQKAVYRDQIQGVVESRRPLPGRADKRVDEVLRKINAQQAIVKECVTQLAAEKTGINARNQEKNRLEGVIRGLDRQMQEAPIDFDPKEYNDRINEVKQEIREIERRQEEHRNGMTASATLSKAKRDTLKLRVQERARLDTQSGQQENLLRRASPDAYRAWQWVQENRNQFEGEVFGPPLVTCSVTDPKYADALETRLSVGDMTAFTCTSNNDARLLQNSFFGPPMHLHNLSIRTSPKPLSFFKPVVENPQNHGFDGYLIDCIRGPEPVLAMLCDSAKLHTTAITTEAMSEARYRELQESQFTSWIHGREMYTVNRRREYSATSTVVKPVRKARFFTDQPVDNEEKLALDRTITELKRDIEGFRERWQELASQDNEFKAEVEALKEQQKEIQAEKDGKQRALSDFRVLPQRKRQREKEMAEVQAHIDGTKRRLVEIKSRGEQAQLKVASLALDYVKEMDFLRRVHDSVIEAEIRLIEANSEADALNEANVDVQTQLKDKEDILKAVKAEEIQLRNNLERLNRRAQAIINELTEAERPVVMEWAQGTDMDNLDAEIQTVSTRLELMAGGDPRAIQDYEQREVEIESLKERIATFDQQLAGLSARITEIRAKWEPQLDQLIAKISDGFARNFEKIGCAGQVGVYKDEEFEQWSIQIQVRFREHEELSILTSQRQSGGERAVSTIFYLMALQDLARSPFRVVDEINQGMDPRNERMVHERMVDIACKERTSQYFLITPKLLNDLKFHPKMKVHCIASGEWMPERHQDLDFQNLARLALRTRIAAAA
ncbi:P-loop containing nucleoside triphosphate hydrolase protein [Delitschia confertaspora ATCC 74209]|uniref:Structural maintenance of chromosomes protein 5 n=1 Tax=Delitschia confertaspora ATCC 74209 TaxID=1513339 RepID=A0A9P4JR32_9PLEO|nr:P-loop containing nucleoside triphosphate hydrolase protein [Delitschia confertaspora ATCC 74209]